jgi:hypothetical protein
MRLWSGSEERATVRMRESEVNGQAIRARINHTAARLGQYQFPLGADGPRRPGPLVLGR